MPKTNPTLSFSQIPKSHKNSSPSNSLRSQGDEGKDSESTLFFITGFAI